MTDPYMQRALAAAHSWMLDHVDHLLEAAADMHSVDEAALRAEFRFE